MKNILDRIKGDLDMEGYSEGTPEYEFLLLERRVQACQDLHRVRACQDCNYVESCGLVREYLVSLRYPNRDKPPG